MAEIVINDLFDELREENNRLLNELLFAQKCIEILEKYRNCLKSFDNNCNCIENLNGKSTLNLLENQYKTVNDNEKQKQSFEEKEEINDKLVKVGVNNEENSVETHEKAFIIESEHNISNLNYGSIILLNNNSIVNNKGLNNKLVLIKSPFITTNINNNRVVNKTDSQQKIKSKDKISKQINTMDGSGQSLVNDRRSECGKQFAHKSSLDLHILCHEGIKPFMCSKGCQYRANTSSEILKHENSYHKSKVEFNCAKCGQKFSNFNKLRNHLYAFHTDFIKCEWPECQFKTKHRKSMKNHIQRHTGNKPFKCVWPGCESAFVTQRELKNHIVFHSNDAQYVCDWPECTAAFKRINSLRTHQYIHSGVKPLECDYPECGKRFVTNQVLNKHKETHSKDKIWVCNYKNCGKAFTGISKLNRHQRLHSTSRTHVCDWNQCENRYETSVQLQRHIKAVHLSDRKYKCVDPDCDKSFADRTNLRNHKKVHIK